MGLEPPQPGLPGKRNCGRRRRFGPGAATGHAGGPRLRRLTTETARVYAAPIVIRRPGHRRSASLSLARRLLAMIVRLGLIPALEGKKDASTT